VEVLAFELVQAGQGSDSACHDRIKSLGCRNQAKEARRYLDRESRLVRDHSADCNGGH